jgi:Flp pilus assembly pilin Flp
MYQSIRTWLTRKHRSLANKAIEIWVKEKGQGTTEYAILVGVLVVIAIIAITLFRPKIQELWDAIAAGINGL